MRFFHSWQNVPPAFQNAVVAIGNFDGFHKGHKAVVETAVKIAKETKTPRRVNDVRASPQRFFPSRRQDVPHYSDPFKGQGDLPAAD